MGWLQTGFRKASRGNEYPVHGGNLRDIDSRSLPADLVSAVTYDAGPPDNSVSGRALDWLFAQLHRRSEKAQMRFTYLITAAGLYLGWKLATLGGVLSLWGLVILIATSVALTLLAMMIAASLVLKSPRWRLLELQRDLADLIRMSGLQFEQFVAELLEARGFSVERRGGRRPDGGIDMIALKNGRSYIVQCKQWCQYIGRPLLQQLYGVVVSNGADGGLFVTTGLYSEPGREFLDGLRSPKLRLIDGNELWGAVQEMRAESALEG